MATAHEELHALIDKLSEQEAKALLQRIKGETNYQQLDLGEWLEQARSLRDAKDQGSLPGVIDNHG